jgi:integrase
LPKPTVRALAKIDKVPGRHPFGDGLYLWVRDPRSRYWTHRYRVGGRQTETSLEPYPDTLLEDVIAKHLAQRALLLEKVDPVGERRARRRVVRAATGAPTFGKAADDYVERMEERGAWRHPKHRQQWRNTLKGLPASFRDLPVDRIGPRQVFEALDPVWHKTPETASRLRGRIAAVLGFTREPEDTRPNPAAWTDWLKAKLGSAKELGKISRKTGERTKRGNHAALPHAETPGFMARLRARGAIRRDHAARALEFLILTAARSGEVRGMVWDEVSFDEKLWTIPASRMKADREHKVPLSDRALLILREQKEARRPINPYCFQGWRPGRSLSDVALTSLLRRMRVTAKVDGKDGIVTAHGFRSAFRDWAGDETHFAREVAEAALAHKVGDKAEQAYRRGDALKKRRELMDAWARYCDGAPEGQVIPIAAARSL